MSTNSSRHARDVAAGERFRFGANWARFLSTVDEESARTAERSLTDMLGRRNLSGSRFLDIGCGSGLFSLSAYRLGAQVRSFDFDPLSVACAREIRARFNPAESEWQIGEGSVLDSSFLAELGEFDVVYSWGVLHHTGDLHRALECAGSCVALQGQLFVAIYNDQGWLSRYWAVVKRTYNRFALARPLIIAVHAPYLLGARWLVRAVTGRLKLERGMSMWHDLIDWLGGYPFEVARPEVVFEFYRQRGFALEKLVTCGGRHGCNQYVFRRISALLQ